ncbi:glycoside hydrolase family 27 protein [Vararia minispora EC-137]|uniref:Glycoside hydrolase family 27 protein n=1 Tax=Vararia minispora EC-137 TaxID=1314806 RepID=A0ACB8QWY5_9AGAM|nr:glycoside hydrolase family 27 protein [Vararia minispora EC-137]
MIPFGVGIEQVRAFDDGAGRLPVMGYNTWNAFACNINETLVLETASLLKSLGLADLGYNYMNIDDCWAEKERAADGSLVPSLTNFPSGMKNLTDQVHGLGLCLLQYSDSGWFTCQMYPGSFMHEEQDAQTFQDWGFDLLKYDNCAEPFDDIIRQGQVGKFQRMAEAIGNLSSPIIYSLCQWGREQPWLWARDFGQSWRANANWNSLAEIINNNSFITWATDFYGRNDMDMVRTRLGNGNSMTYDEEKSHFTAWALMKSPLLIGTDLRTVTNETLEILSNEEIIAINQDPVVGTSISPFRWGINPDWSFNKTFPAQYWSGKSQNGTIFMLLNTLDTPQDMTFQLTESPWIRAGRQYSVRDLWTHTDNGTAVRNFTAHAVPPHGVVALLLRDVGDEPDGILPPCAVIEWCTAENGTRYDGQ